MKHSVLLICCLMSLTVWTAQSRAQEIWTGPSTPFAKANGADWNLATSQDRITENVWITRQSSRGIFNIRVETEYDNTTNVSPIGTEWAVGDVADWSTLTYQSFFNYAGGRVGDNILALGPSVVHLIADDIYIPIEFTAWTGGAGGGGFSYTRGTRDPSPVESTTWGAVKALYDL